MSSIAFNQKMKKSEFEAKVVADLGMDGLTCCPYVEEGKHMTLYYKNGVHVGTWIRSCGISRGWIFTSAYPKPTP